MKRKSQEIAANIVRSLKKHKTVGYKQKKHESMHRNNSRISEILVSQIIQQITEDVQNKIKLKAHQELVNSIIQTSQFMAANLNQLVYLPLEENSINSVILDKEPDRVAFDPICGFDKLITIKNGMSSTKTQEASFLQSKSKPFGVFQNGKKQQSIQKSLSTASKLIPLDSLNLASTKSEKESEKQQSFYRQRIYDSGLPMLAVPVFKKLEKTSTSKLGFQNSRQNPSEDCVFDYNGQKTTLSVASKLSSLALKQSPNNVLRTTYRVVENMNEDKKKISLSKGGNFRGSQAMEIYRVSKQIIKNPNLSESNEILDSSILKYRDSAYQSEAMKNILEASFREKQLVLRPIERTHRPSKIL